MAIDLPRPIPESFKQEITNRMAALHEELESMPVTSQENPEFELALKFLRAVVYRFGYNAQVGMRMVGATLLPGQTAPELSVEVPEADYDAWGDAVWGYMSENPAYGALLDLAHNWEEILANFASEGNWQAYGLNVAFEEIDNDAAQYERIQKSGLVQEMQTQFTHIIQRSTASAYLGELVLIQQQMERIFVREP